MRNVYLLIAATLVASNVKAQTTAADSAVIRSFYNKALTDKQGYRMLHDLCKNVGNRVSGSPAAEKAVKFEQDYLKSIGADTVYLQEVMVPHWVRGDKEVASITSAKSKTPVTVNVLALGGSIGTSDNGLKAQVVEVDGMDALKNVKAADVKGKIVFFNGPMDQTELNTFDAYGPAVAQRGSGAVEAAKLGAVGVVVRSVATITDSHPHTGAMHYADTIQKIPAIAIATEDADLLSNTLKQDPNTQFYFKTNCKTLDDVKSYNVIAELRGSELPNEILAVGGHLDSWDVGEGAHDDGSGVTHATEVIRLMKQTGYKPRRTIRVVCFMNEENGLRGGKKYAELAKASNQKHLLALESDAGGFSPRGFAFDAKDEAFQRIMKWQPLMEKFGVDKFEQGHSGADVSRMEGNCDVLGELMPDSQRYFDVHHSANDVFEAVNARELELGAGACTAIVYLFDKYWTSTPR